MSSNQEQDGTTPSRTPGVGQVMGPPDGPPPFQGVGPPPGPPPSSASRSSTPESARASAPSLGAGRSASPVKSPRQAIREFIAPKQSSLIPKENAQAEPAARKVLFKIPSSPAEQQRKLRSVEDNLPSGKPVTPGACLDSVQDKLNKLGLDEKARAIMEAEMAQLRSIIVQPSARRNVAQEEAENLLYAEGTGLVNDYCKMVQNLTATKTAMTTALRSKMVDACDWQLVDMENQTAVDEAIRKDMDSSASPEIQHLNDRITSIDSQITLAQAEYYSKMRVLYQLPGGERTRRVETKDYKPLKDLHLENGTTPEKGMKFLHWAETVLKLNAPQWLLLWPALRKLLDMNKHLDSFRFPTKNDLAEKSVEQIKELWCLDPESIEPYSNVLSELAALLRNP